MRKITAFAYATMAALGLSFSTSAYALTETITKEMLSKYVTDQSNTNVVIDASEGLSGKYSFSGLFVDGSTIYVDNNTDYLICEAPANYVFTGVTIEGGGNWTYDLYGCVELPALGSWSTSDGTFIGRENIAANPQKLDAQGKYQYIVVQFANNSTTLQKFVFDMEEGTAAGPGASGSFDHLSTENLMAANPNANFSATSYNDAASVNELLSYTGDTGTEYEFTDVNSDGTWWANAWIDPNPAGTFYNTTAPAGYLKSINLVFNDWVESSYSFFVSEEPITSENKWDAKQIYLYNSDAGYPRWEADGKYKYFYFNTSQMRLKDVVVEWTDETPVVYAPAPEVNCWANPVTPNSEINISAQAGFKIDVKVYYNDVLDNEKSKVWDESGSFVAGGVAGQTLKVEAYTFADDYENSEVVSKVWTLTMPPASAPVSDDLGKYVLPGITGYTLTSSTENAKITYKVSYKDSSNADNNREFDPVTAVSPVTVKVPADAPVGAKYEVTATAIADGYSESTEFYSSVSIVSDKLEAPKFSLEDNAVIEKGTKLKIERSPYGSTIHYTVNDGEEQTYSQYYYVEVPVTEDATITAWVTGNDPFKPSDKVTIKLYMENFPDEVHVLVPETFTTDAADLKNYKKNRYDATVNNVDYVYDGGLYGYLGRNCFYISTEGSILYNTTPIEKGYSRVRIDSGSTFGGATYLIVSDEPFTEVTEAMSIYEDPEASNVLRLRIGKATETAPVNAGYGEWINLGDYIDVASALDGTNAAAESEKKSFVPKYAAVYRFGTQTNYMARVLLDSTPSGDNSGVDAIGTELSEGDAAFYDLNGVRVDGGNLAPGIYVRVAGGKTVKFVVK